jgi:hypothetical protein
MLWTKLLEKCLIEKGMLKIEGNVMDKIIRNVSYREGRMLWKKIFVHE